MCFPGYGAARLLPRASVLARIRAGPEPGTDVRAGWHARPLIRREYGSTCVKGMSPSAEKLYLPFHVHYTEPTTRKREQAFRVYSTCSARAPYTVHRLPAHQAPRIARTAPLGGYDISRAYSISA